MYTFGIVYVKIELLTSNPEAIPYLLFEVTYGHPRSKPKSLQTMEVIL